jgi:hypothetical protein
MVANRRIQDRATDRSPETFCEGRIELRSRNPAAIRDLKDQNLSLIRRLYTGWSGKEERAGKSNRQGPETVSLSIGGAFAGLALSTCVLLSRFQVVYNRSGI